MFIVEFNSVGGSAKKLEPRLEILRRDEALALCGRVEYG